jgi:AcrR family transcriptional regulator
VPATTAVDRRISRTRRQLTAALVSLTLTRGFETLTVRDLTEEAAIGYATFFRHYQDKEALLNATLELAITHLVATVAPFSEQPQPMLEAMFTELGRDPDLYRALLMTRHVTRLSERVFEIGTAVFLDRFKLPERHGLPADLPAILIARHVVGAVVNLIEWWLEETERESPARMARFINALVMQPITLESA